jgi:hypothetical protein
MKTLAAFAVAVSLALPAHAHLGPDAGFARVVAGSPGPLVGTGAIELAANVQRSVAVNRPRLNDSWRCDSKAGDVLYYATADGEAAARAILGARVTGAIYCSKRSIGPGQSN